jgi:hypothetical protein
MRLRSAHGEVNGDFVVTSAEVLDEGMASGDDGRGTGSLRSPHGSQSGLEPAVTGLDGIVCVALHDMAGVGHHVVEHPQVDRRPIGGDLGRTWHLRQASGGEPPGGARIRGGRKQHVDDLAELVDGPMQVTPATTHPDVGLIDEPSVRTTAGRAGPRR